MLVHDPERNSPRELPYIMLHLAVPTGPAATLERLVSEFRIPAPFQDDTTIDMLRKESQHFQQF
jgi:hypothetical protein